MTMDHVEMLGNQRRGMCVVQSVRDTSWYSGASNTAKSCALQQLRSSTLFPRRGCGKVAPAGQSRCATPAPLDNLPSVIGIFVSDRFGSVSGAQAMMDGLSELYRDLLSGSYDCVDRIVLNAYFGMAHSPGGFRIW
jgi:hypothetical protein